MSRSLLPATVACALVFFSGQSAGASADADTQEPPAPRGYILNIDDDGPGADALARGDFAAAAAQASAYSRHHASLSVYLTLCVANIGLGQLEAAAEPCDSAVDLAAKPLTTSRNPHGHANREGLAKAHANRGVLRALDGDLSGAQADFDKASKQRRFREMVRHNRGIAASAQTVATSQ